MAWEHAPARIFCGVGASYRDKWMNAYPVKKYQGILSCVTYCEIPNLPRTPMIEGAERRVHKQNYMLCL